jgi:hypothetical protein
MADATVTLGLDASQLKTGLAKATTDVSNFATKSKKSFTAAMGARLGGMGSAIAGLGVGMKIKSTIDEYARLADLSNRLGVSAESLQRVGMAAEQSGTDMETAARALTILMKALDSPENESAAKAFEELGLSMDALKSADAFEQIQMLQQAFQKSQQTGRGFADIMKLMGKAGAELVPMLRMTTGEMQSMATADVVSNEQIAQIAKLDDQLVGIQRRLSIGFAKGTAGAVSIIDKATENLTGLAVGAGEFASNLMAGKGFMESLNSGFMMVADLADQKAQDDKESADAAQKEADARKDSLESMDGIVKAAKEVKDAAKEEKALKGDRDGDGIISRREQRKLDLEQKRAERKANSIKGFSRESRGLKPFAGLDELREMDMMKEMHGFASVGLRFAGVKSTDPVGTTSARYVQNDKGGWERVVASQDKLYNLLDERFKID